MNEKIDFAELANLSPFELKNKLIDVAATSTQKPMLNAGRGNLNFLATIPRLAFFQMGRFAMQEAENSWIYMPEGVGGFPQRDGIEGRFDIFTHANLADPGVKFLRSAVSYVRDHLGISAGDFIYEMSEAILGCNYPVPDRMLALSEQIVNQYIRKEMIDMHPFTGEFDLFATEGGTAAMTYIFDSLRENKILGPGDHIALGLPIFTPYIEIPKLNDYRLNTVEIQADEGNNWQFPNTELDKLLDNKVKAFFLVNPSNPPSVKLSDDNLRRLQNIVSIRPDLIILTDDVYGTFADNFTSLFATCPQNTILVYSYSKYFGATGWRMGVIAMHRNNIIDKMISRLPDADKKELHERYESIATEPDDLKFIDRMVADSRTVALNHTAGLATPVQVQMVMFSLFALMDKLQGGDETTYQATERDAVPRLLRKSAAGSRRGGVLPAARRRGDLPEGVWRGVRAVVCEVAATERGVVPPGGGIGRGAVAGRRVRHLPAVIPGVAGQSDRDGIQEDRPSGVQAGSGALRRVQKSRRQTKARQRTGSSNRRTTPGKSCSDCEYIEPRERKCAFPWFIIFAIFVLQRRIAFHHGFLPVSAAAVSRPSGRFRVSATREGLVPGRLCPETVGFILTGAGREAYAAA